MKEQYNWEATKTCTQCGETKPVEEFYMRLGERHAYCKDCYKKYDRARYYKNSQKKIEAEWEKDWEGIWKPLLYTDGKLDINKIKNEMHDLWFIYQQVGLVYCEITGGTLSKPMYYADQIIDLHNKEVEESYQQGSDQQRKALVEDCQKLILDQYEKMLVVFEGKLPLVLLDTGQSEEEKHTAYYEQGIKDAVRQLDIIKAIKEDNEQRIDV